MSLVGSAKRRILLELRGRRLHGYGLAHALGIPVTGIYQHLRDLREEGLVTATVDGRRKLYGLTTKGSKLAELLRE